MAAYQASRWTLEAFVEPSDKVRIRGFIRNEISYYNALLGSMSARLRTMPEIFESVSSNLVGETALRGLPKDVANITERNLLFLEGIAVQKGALHPYTRQAMAVEMLAAHRKLASALSNKSNKSDQTLAMPVELLSPHDGRVKRHVQLPSNAVTVIDNQTIRIAYAGSPIILKGQFPATAWNILVLRDLDRPGAPGGAWSAEFRNDASEYLLRLTDPPIKAQRRVPERNR